MKNIVGLVVALSLVSTAAWTTETFLGNLEAYGSIHVAQGGSSDGGWSDGGYWFGDIGVRMDPSTTPNDLSFGYYVGFEALGFIGSGGRV